jgi:hypothetical protein
MLLLAALAAASLAPGAAHADPQALSRFVPVTIEDAYPLGTGKIEFQGTGVWDHDTHGKRGDDLFTLTPTLKYGPFPGAQISVGVPYRLGDASRRYGGATSFAAFYNFNNQGDVLPAFAVSASYDEPFGADPQSRETSLRFVATKSLGDPYRAPRVHLNLSWNHLTDPIATERRDRYELAIGYSQSLGEHTAAVVDYVRAEKRTKGANSNIVEAGLRHELTPHWTVAGGVGVGFAEESQDFRVLVALQRSFDLSR